MVYPFLECLHLKTHNTNLVPGTACHITVVIDEYFDVQDINDSQMLYCIM